MDDPNGNGLPNWWELEYFGNTDESATNLDFDGNTLLSDYQNNLDPDVIQFSLAATNNYVATSNSQLGLNISCGIPGSVAISVDDTNYLNDADWHDYTGTNLNVNLGTTQGWHNIWVGLKGFATNATVTWQWERLKLDLTPPQIVITNPVSGTLTQPLLELQGYSPEALSSISYDLTNALGLVTNQQIVILDQAYSTNTWEFTTNSFQGFDIPLTNGLNTITIHASDLAGNTTVTNFNFIVDYSSKTNPPTVQICWPPNGIPVCGNVFTLRGQVADPTVTTTLQFVDTNGLTNTLFGEMERNGRFWLENLPLNSGTNLFTLTVADVASNVWTTNLSVVQSPMTLTMNPVSDNSQLWQSNIDISGLISDPTASILVNGVEGTNNGDGTWSANDVPVSPGGVAIFDINATSLDGNEQADNASTDKPMRLYIGHYQMSVDGDYVNTNGDVYETSHTDLEWTDGTGGEQNDLDTVDGVTLGSDQIQWPATGDGSGSDYFASEGWSVVSNVPPPTSGVDWPMLVEESGTLQFAAGTPPWYKYKYTGQAQMKLQTGGKADVSRQNLWQLSATATAQSFQPGNNPVDGYNLISQGVPSQNITIHGKALGSDGNLWTTLPDSDQPIDVTPTVSGVGYYSFGENAQKYTMDITANGIDLSTNDPTNCVGELVDFAPLWSPSVPPAVEIVSLWNLPQTYVNNPYEYSPTCTSYNINPNLLFNYTTACWFINGLGGNVNLAESLTFANGQQAEVTAKGKISIYTPTFQNPLNLIDQGKVALYPGQGIATGHTVFGLQPPSGNSVSYSDNVRSTFPGTAQLTQLLIGQASGTVYTFNTEGLSYLDKAEPYPYEGPAHTA
ncbi:MAG: hypothetical protein ABSF34_10345, partial [Verrucomicrobiota bacterium]